MQEFEGTDLVPRASNANACRSSMYGRRPRRPVAHRRSDMLLAGTFETDARRFRKVKTAEQGRFFVHQSSTARLNSAIVVSCRARRVGMRDESAACHRSSPRPGFCELAVVGGGSAMLASKVATTAAGSSAGASGAWRSTVLVSRTRGDGVWRGCLCAVVGCKKPYECRRRRRRRRKSQ